MRVAAVDIGTNSVHMLVVRVREDLSFEVIDREKAMVRLGAGGWPDGTTKIVRMDKPPLCVLCRTRPRDDRWQPFCSERCRNEDLARWADGRYRAAGDPLPAPDGNSDSDPDSDPD